MRFRGARKIIIIIIITITITTPRAGSLDNYRGPIQHQLQVRALLSLSLVDLGPAFYKHSHEQLTNSKTNLLESLLATKPN